jgi:hypothetical protein
MEDKSARHLDGTTVYNIRVVSNLRLKDEAETKGKRAPEDRARSQFRPDVAFINPRRRQIVVGMAFSGHNAEHQNDQAARYLLPLQELTQRTGSDFFDWTLVPFYIHAGTFVPEDFETTRAGIETSKALQTNNVPMEQRRAMAAFELMSVGMRATSPAQVQAFFQCNPLVGGVSTLEHLRHVEKTINLPKQDAMEQHARFLTRQAELALAACAQICAAENTKGEVQAVVRGVGAFLDNAAKAFGDVSPAFYAEVWEPMLEQVEKICSSVTTNYGSSNQLGHTPIPREEINNWGDTARRAKALKNRGYDGMKEDHAEHMELIGSQDVLVDTFDIKDVPKADLVEMNSEAKPRGKRGRGR